MVANKTVVHIQAPFLLTRHHAMPAKVLHCKGAALQQSSRVADKVVACAASKDESRGLVCMHGQVVTMIPASQWALKLQYSPAFGRLLKPVCGR